MANRSPNQSAADHQLSKVNLGYLVFMSRWLQAPLYFGLIVAQAYYVWRFMLELLHLVTSDSNEFSDSDVLLAVLALVDVVMIANLLIMVIIGGYETFVARLRIDNHPDQPEWLSHVNANVLKVKLAMAIIGISSITCSRPSSNLKSTNRKRSCGRCLSTSLLCSLPWHSPSSTGCR